MFFIRDPLKFPDLNHAIKRDPRTEPQPDKQLGFLDSPSGGTSSNHDHPCRREAFPLRSEICTVSAYHTYSFINKDNKRTRVKFHFRTLQGIKNLSDKEAENLIAKDRESHQRDLFEAIERGDFPRWKLQVQLMTEEEAKEYNINPFDLTKVWYHKDFPLRDVGITELNRNPDNFFTDIEQAAFNPMNFVDGIGLSPDKMLQGRLFAYGDAQRYRLGVNHNLIPVNRPKCPFHSYHRDGQMRTDDNYGATVPYGSNSFGEWKDSPELKEPPLEVHGGVFNYDEREYDSDYYTQPENCGGS